MDMDSDQRVLRDEELDDVAGAARVVTACECGNAWEAWTARYFNICPGDTSWPR